MRRHLGVIAYLASLAVLALPAIAEPPAAQELTALQADPTPQAGFDCTMARGALETTICADPQTAEADRAMALAYRAQLAQAADPDFAAALRADQRSFLAIRRQGWEVKPNRQMALDYLRDATELRAEWLNWVSSAPEAGLLGTWANAWGILEVTRASDGNLLLAANVADQIAGTWLCGYDGALVEQGRAQAIGRTLTEDLKILRSGVLLEVASEFCDESGPAINGSMKGLYFRIGAGD